MFSGCFLFPVVWIFPRYLGVICFDRWVPTEGHKNYYKDWCVTNSQSPFVFNLFLTQWIMAILLERCKPDNFQTQNSLKISFMNIQGLCSNFVECESFFESNSLDILALWEQTWMTQLILGISLWGTILFNPKRFYYSYTWSCNLCERRTSFCTGLISRKLCRFLFVFLSGFTSLSVLLCFPSIDHLLQVCAQFLILFHLT